MSQAPVMRKISPSNGVQLVYNAANSALVSEAYRRERELVAQQTVAVNAWIKLGELCAAFDRDRMWAQLPDPTDNPVEVVDNETGEIVMQQRVFSSFDDWAKKTPEVDHTEVTAAKQAYEQFVIEWGIAQSELALIARTKFIDINPAVSEITKETRAKLREIERVEEGMINAAIALSAAATSADVAELDFAQMGQPVSVPPPLEDIAAQTDTARLKVIAEGSAKVREWVSAAQDLSRNELQARRAGGKGWRTVKFKLSYEKLLALAPEIASQFAPGDIDCLGKQLIDKDTGADND